MSSIATAFLAVVAGLFPIVNPLGMAPIFLRLTSGSSSHTRARLASRIAVGGFALMVASLFVGTHILAFFGMTVQAVQIGGGFVVVAAGWRLLHQGDDASARQQQSGVTEDTVLDRAFFPLTMPLTVGPGTISVAITLGAKSAGNGHPWVDIVGGLLGSAAVALTIYLSYRFADRLLGILGEGGRNVFLRLSAFILLCLGIQIVWNGYSALINLPSAG
jgi:multiple antibiotic resistance protein